MKKLLLMAVIIASLVVPLWLARARDPIRAYRRLVWTMLGIIFVWAVLIRYLYYVL